MEAVPLRQIWVCPCVIYSSDEAGKDETDIDMLARAEKCREKMFNKHPEECACEAGKKLMLSTQ